MCRGVGRGDPPFSIGWPDCRGSVAHLVKLQVVQLTASVRSASAVPSISILSRALQPYQFVPTPYGRASPSGERTKLRVSNGLYHPSHRREQVRCVASRPRARYTATHSATLARCTCSRVGAVSGASPRPHTFDITLYIPFVRCYVTRRLN